MMLLACLDEVQRLKIGNPSVCLFVGESMCCAYAGAFMFTAAALSKLLFLEVSHSWMWR